MKKIFKILLIIFLIGILIFTLYICNTCQRESRALEKYGDTVTKFSFLYNVDANIVLAVIKAESNFNESAVSDKGAKGLMQILPSTGEYIAGILNEDYSGINLFDYETNIRYGTFYLSYLLKKFENLECASAAYNAGEGNVYLWLTKYSDDGKNLNYIPFKETQNYVEKVKTNYENFKRNYNY